MRTTRPIGIAALILGVLWTGPGANGEEPVKSPIREAEMAGYLLVPHEKVPETFNAGFSMYVAAWPLLKNYPGSRFEGTCHISSVVQR